MPANQHKSIHSEVFHATLGWLCLMILAGCTSGKSASPELNTENPTGTIACGNGQGCGGGGKPLSDAKTIIDSVLSRYERKGVMPGVGRAYESCTQNHSALQCGRLQKSGAPEMESAIVRAQTFLENHAGDLRKRLNTLSITGVDGPLHITTSAGETKMVWARHVPGVGIEFDRTYLQTAPQNDVTGLLVHELSHTVTSLSSVSEEFLDYVGAMVATDPMLIPSKSRELILAEKDHLLAYLPFSESAGSTQATNWVTGGVHGQISGSVVTGVTGIANGDGAFQFVRTGLAGGCVELRNVDLKGATELTSEFWMKMDRGFADPGTEPDVPANSQSSPFSLGVYGLWTFEHGFGFNTFAGDATGVESTYYGGRWVHVAAVFSHLGQNQRLYLDGVEQPIARRRWFMDADRALVAGDLITIGCYGQGTGLGFGGLIDEVALYNRALPAEVVRQHAGVGELTTIDKATHSLLLAKGTSHTGAIEVPGKSPCAGAAIVTSAIRSASAETPNLGYVATATGTSPLRSHGYFLESKFYLAAGIKSGTAANDTLLTVDYEIRCPR